MGQPLIALVAVAVTGCGGGHSANALASKACGGSGSTSPSDMAALRASVSFEGDVASRAQHVSEVLPGSRGDVSDSAVVGTVASVTRGSAFAMTFPPPENGPTEAPVDYDDPAASWRSLDVTIDVSETLAGPSARTVTVPWGLPGNSTDGVDDDAACRALLHIGRVVVFSHATPGSSAGYYGISRMMMDMHYNFATVDAVGGLHFPFIGSGEEPSEATFLDGVRTLTQLREAVKTRD